MQTRKGLSMLVFGLVLAGSFTLFTACEKDKDGTDLDRYFSDNPYISDPRTLPESRRLEINPGTKAASSVGEQISFSVKGGSGSTYRWDVANTDYGTIARQSNTRNAIYTVKQLADNSVIVSDSEGSAGIAYVTASSGSLAVTPDGVDYTTDNPTAYDGRRFTLLVTGGQPPYGDWTLSGSSLVSIVNPARPRGEFEINNPDPTSPSSESFSYVTIMDNKGAKVRVKITLSVTSATQPLSVTPDEVNYNTDNPTGYDGRRFTLLVTGGQPPYGDWTLSGSSLVSIVNPARPRGEFEINNPDPTSPSSVNTSFVTVVDSLGNKVSVKVTLTVSP